MKSSVRSPKQFTEVGHPIALRVCGKLALSLILTQAMTSCAGLPSNPNHTKAQQTTRSSAVAASAYKAGPDDASAMSIHIEADGQNQKLRVSLAPRLVAKSASNKGFHTQASDISQLAYISLSVSGPDIRVPIQNTGGLIPITGVSNQDIVIEGVPRGINHVVTAQFYDADQLPVNNAVAMGVYSSRDGTNVSVLRRFLTLGRVLKSLFNSNANLARNLDAAALQAKIDQLIYGSATPGPFVVDPSLVNINQIVADVLASSGDVASLNLSQPIYVFDTSSLTLPVSGLLGSDTLTVRVDDPTSTAITQGNGTITITNIAPGTWPVYVKLNSNTGFSYPNTTLGVTVVPPSVPNQTTPSRLLISAQTFTPANTAAQPNYTLIPAALQFTTSPGLFTRSGQQLTITGSGFYPGSTTLNKVRFTRGLAEVDATIVSATATELVVTVPAVAQAGDYDLEIAVGNGSFTSLGIAVLNVLTATPNGPNYNALTSNGQGWSNAINLQAALSTAAAGDEIWLAAGSYKPGALRTDTFTLKSDVPIYGGFAGNETMRSARDFSANISILEGDIAGNDNVTISASDPNRSENSYHVVTTDVANTSLDGVTIQGGHAISGATDGGGLLNNNVISNLTNLIFKSNTADYGGGLYINGGNVVIDNVSFINNVVSNAGAGVFIQGGANPSLNSVYFANNAAVNGGGIYGSSGTFTLTNGRFLNNSATGGLGGGGIYNGPGSSANVNETVFMGNNASNGGAVYNYTSSPVYTNVIFTGNTTTGQGGGMFNNFSSNPKLVNVTFNGNTATSGGSALYNNSGAPVFVNVLLWNNVLGNISLPGGQGNLQAGADPFFNSADPDGVDNIWFTADDGLALNAGMPGTSIDQGIASFGGVTIPTIDAVGVARPLGLYDPGAYEQPYQPLSLNVTSGSSSDPVIITGTNLSGSTSVKFNGREASSFTIDSPTQITARVPFGLASNGKVSVLTPTGPALSGSSFTITNRIHVVRASASGNNSGNSWTNAHTNLQTALTNAVAGDEIWVAAGSYKPGTLRADTFTLKANVPIYGGFAGNEVIRSARDFSANISILEGDISGNDNPVASTGDSNRSENSFHVVTTGVANTTLDGFTIQGGHAFSGASDGGGLLNNTVISNLSNLIFKSNTAINGGGLFINGGNAIINNVSFISNATSSSGAGVFSQGGANPSLTNVTFTGNTCGNGGGMYVSSGTATLNNSVFSGNTSTGPLGGGGMYVSNGANANLTKAVFSGNTAPNGGGIYTFNSSPTLTNVIFTGNAATNQGGGFFNNSTGSPKLVNVTFNGNTAISSGSAHYRTSGTTVSANVLLWNNSYGGVALPGGQGNVQAGSDPFVNSADPDGADNIWFTSDDGLQLSSNLSEGYNQGLTNVGGVTYPIIDILGVSRPQNGNYDTGAYEKP